MREFFREAARYDWYRKAQRKAKAKAKPHKKKIGILEEIQYEQEQKRQKGFLSEKLYRPDVDYNLIKLVPRGEFPGAPRKAS